MVADTYDFVSYLWRYNETILQFAEVIINAKVTYISPVLSTTILDKTMIETTQVDGVFFYRYDSEEERVIEQQSNFLTGSILLTHTFSIDKRFAVVGGYGYIRIYYNCNHNTVTRGYWYNSAAISCDLCS